MNISLYLLLSISIILIFVSLISLSSDIKEGFKTTRDFQLELSNIQNIRDFKDYCIARTGTENIENLDMKNETKLKVIEDYLKGIEHMKELARMNKISINREPLYGLLSKNNKTNDFTNFRKYL